MGAGACQIIIDDGNKAYGIIGTLSSRPINIELSMLEAAVQGSCQAIHHASLYFLFEGEEEKVSAEYTDPIINIHHTIIAWLPNNYTQHHVDKLANELFIATKRLEELYD